MYILMLTLLFISFLNSIHPVHAHTIIANDQLVPQWNTGWRVSSSASPTSDWVRIGTEGNGHPMLLASRINEVNLKQKIIKLRCRINSIDFLQHLELRLSTNKNFDNYLAMTVPLYTDKRFNLLQDHSWHTLSFGLANAKPMGEIKNNTINYLGIYLQDNQIAPVILDFTDITILDAPYPAVVSYTFDDGHSDHLTAAKLMKPVGHRGTAYIIPDKLGKKDYLTLQQLVELKNLGWGISFHHHISFTDFSATVLKSEINEGFKFFQANHLTNAMHHLAYPLGRQNRSYVLPLVRKYFRTARVASGGLETLPPGDPHLLRAVNVLSSTTPNEIHDLLKAAKANNQWLILMFHHLGENPQNDLQYDIENFREIIKRVDQEKITVLPIHEVWDKFLHP